MTRSEDMYCLPIEKFLGLNITSSDQSSLKKGESPFMKNFSITDTYAIKKRDGYKRLYDFSGVTRAMTISDDTLFMAVSNDIFACTLPLGDNVRRVGGVADSDNCFFVKFGGEIYLWGGGRIQVYRDGAFVSVTPYRPLIAVSCIPETGAGSPLEGVNMLCTQVRKQYSPSSGSRTFVISKTPVKSVDYVKVNGEEVSSDSYNASKTGIVMEVGNGVEEGTNTVEIGYTLSDSDASHENYEKVTSCKYHMFYGGENDTKIFLWGNDSFPDARIWSQAADGIPSAVYFPEDNYTRIGDGAKICDIVRQYDRQLIFCESAAYLSSIESGTDILGRRTFSFPVRTLSDAKGSAVCGQTRLIENSPVTLTRDGLYKWVSTAQRDERNAVKISERIDEALLKEDIPSAKMFDCEQKGELYVYFPNGRVYVYCYRKDVFTLYDGIFAHTFASDARGNVYFCDSDGGLFVFGDMAEDDGRAIECEWQSGYLDMGYEGQKNMYSVSLVYYPHTNTHFTLQWCGDNDATNILCDVIPTVSDGVADFENTDFEAGETGIMSIVTIKIKHKNFLIFLFLSI